MIQPRDAGRWRRADNRQRPELALRLAVELVRRRRILRIHLGHHELAQQLDLLHLGERDLVAHLNGLQIADRGLILHLEPLQRRLLALKILGLRLRALQRTVQGIERGIDARLRALHTRRSGHAVAGVELLELLGESLEGVGKALLLGNQPAEIGEQVLVGLPAAGAAAGGVFDRVLKLLSQIGDGRGLLLQLLELARDTSWDRRLSSPTPNIACAGFGSTSSSPATAMYELEVSLEHHCLPPLLTPAQRPRMPVAIEISIAQRLACSTAATSWVSWPSR